MISEKICILRTDLVPILRVKYDKDSFKDLFDTYYNPLCNFCYRFVENHTDAEDVVQDVFTSFWQKQDRIKIETDVKYYLFTSVRNKAIEYIRSKKRKMNLEDEMGRRSESSYTEEFMEENLIKELISNSVRQLPPKCRQIFVMSKVNGLTYVEIADQLNLSTKTIENQMRRAFQILRKTLKVR